jgi:hypothetical protein
MITKTKDAPLTDTAITLFNAISYRIAVMEDDRETFKDCTTSVKLYDLKIKQAYDLLDKISELTDRLHTFEKF